MNEDCQQWLIQLNRAHPRSCAICGLGPCQYGVTPIPIHKSDVPPDTLYELMAEAMLDPKLRKVLVHEGVVFQSGTTPTGNATRKEVLLRALEAAKAQGWELVKR